MTYNPIKQPYIQTTKVFITDDPVELKNTLTKMYTETALALNERIIGIFDQFQATTGEKWFNELDTLKRRQSYRKIYIGNGALATFNHDLAGITQPTRLFGIGKTSSTTWIPLPYIHPTASNQIGLEVSDTQIIVNTGGTAPAILSWFIDFEFILS